MRHPKVWIAVASIGVAAACGGPAEELPAGTDAEGRLIPSEVVDPNWQPPTEIVDAEGVWEEDIPNGWATPSPITDPVIKDDVLVIEPYRAQHWGIEPSRLVVPIAGNEELILVTPGYKVISAYLFSRVVESVERHGDELVFETRDAVPADVIARGSIRFPDGVVAGTFDPLTGERAWFDERDNPFQKGWDPNWRLNLVEPELGTGGPFGAVTQGAEGGLDVSGPEVSIERSLGGEVGNGFRVDSAGNLTIKPLASVNFRPLFRVHLDLDSNWAGVPYVEYFEVRAEGTIEWMLGVEVTGTRAVRGSFSFPILGQRDATSRGTFPIHVRCFSTPTVMVGPVPIWADICPKLEFEASAEASASIQMRATVSGSKTIGGGLRFRKATGWYRYTVNPPATTNKEITLSASLAFKASGGLTPKANVNIWSLAGPFIAFPFGLEFESKCAPPTLNHELKAFLAATAGVATDPQGIASWVVPKWQVQMQLFKVTTPLPLPAALGNTVCSPGYVQLDYNRMVANANTSRTLELDMVLEIPAEGANRASKISNSSALRTIAGSANSYPFASFQRADCAGCPEQVALALPLPGDYKVWVYDYENSARATNAMSAAGTKVTVNLGRPQEFTAPGGTYNKWTVATIRVDAQRRMTVIPCSSGCTQSVDLIP